MINSSILKFKMDKNALFVFYIILELISLQKQILELKMD